MPNKMPVFPPLSVLLVEDDPPVRDVLSRGLLAYGFEVRTAEDGEQALECVRLQVPDVVICDVSLPGRDGLELLRILKENYPAIEVIMATAYADLKTGLAAMKRGAFDYLTKPVDLTELSALICRARARGRLRAYTAEEYARLKSDFVATVSHELRTPLVSVMGYISLLLKGVYGGPSVNQRQALERAEAGAQRLLELVNGIVDFSNLESGQLALSPTTFPLREAIDELVCAVGPAAAAKGLTFTARIPEGLSIRADRGKLMEILGCLVSNGVKFTPQGGVTVEGTLSPDGARVEITVSDTGIGIELDDLNILFKEFRQIDSSATRPFGGAGLGLVLAKRLAAAMGGSLMVDSKPREGSRFTLTIPIGLRMPRVQSGEAA